MASVYQFIYYYNLFINYKTKLVNILDSSIVKNLYCVRKNLFKVKRKSIIKDDKTLPNSNKLTVIMNQTKLKC